MFDYSNIPYRNCPAWINGTECTVKDLTVSILDLGLIHSDATYDVIAFRKGIALEFDWHLDRFITSCEAWRLPLPYSKEQLKDIVTSVHKRTTWANSIIWISITRGIPSSGNPRDLRNCIPQVVVYAKPYQQFNGTNLATVCSATTVTRVPDCSINQNNKNFVWNDLTTAQWEAIDQGFDTAVLFGTTGFLTEGPGFNVAIVKDHCVYAPKANRLPGVSMRIVEKLCNELDIPFAWVDITAEQVDACDDMFLTTTIGNLVTVTQYNERKLTVSDVQRKLIEALNNGS